MVWFHQEVAPGIVVGFTDSSSGNLANHVNDLPEAVTSNRDLLNAEITALTGSATKVELRYMNQVHGNQVALISPEAERSNAPTADAMVSAGTPLAVMVADCVPVVLVGEGADNQLLFAVAHAGRPGVEKDVVSSTVSELRKAGAAKISAWIGPSVCGKCYEVPAQMREAVAAREPASFSTTSWGTPALDLPAAVAQQLNRADVMVVDVGVCTLESSNFFSHRRAVRDGETEGRFIGFVASGHS